MYCTYCQVIIQCLFTHSAWSVVLTMWVNCALLYVTLCYTHIMQVIPNTGSKFEEVIESLRKADDRYQDASVRVMWWAICTLYFVVLLFNSNRIVQGIQVVVYEHVDACTLVFVHTLTRTYSHNCTPLHTIALMSMHTHIYSRLSLSFSLLLSHLFSDLWVDSSLL